MWTVINYIPQPYLLYVWTAYLFSHFLLFKSGRPLPWLCSLKIYIMFATLSGWNSVPVRNTNATNKDPDDPEDCEKQCTWEFGKTKKWNSCSLTVHLQKRMTLYALMLQFCRLIVSTEEISTNSGPWITNICPKKFDSKHYSFCMYDNEQTGVCRSRWRYAWEAAKDGWYKRM